MKSHLAVLILASLSSVTVLAADPNPNVAAPMTGHHEDTVKKEADVTRNPLTGAVTETHRATHVTKNKQGKRVERTNEDKKTVYKNGDVLRTTEEKIEHK